MSRNALALPGSARFMGTTLVALCVLTVCGSGHAAPTIAINLPANGTGLLATSAFYDPADQTVEVRGAFLGIAAGTASDYQVLLNGLVSSVGAGPGNSAPLCAAVPVGPSPPPGLASWPSWVPYVNQFQNTEAIVLPILAELYHMPTQRVVARHRVVLIDKRWDDDMVLNATGALSNSLAFELTETGLDALEPAHASSLPQPGLTQFNNDLTAEFAGTLRALAPDTSFSSATKACVGVESYPGLTAADAFAEVELAAWESYAVFVAADRVCGGGDATDLINLVPGLGWLGAAALEVAACSLKNNQCVREQPRVDRFEICVGEVEGAGNTLTIAGVNSVDLALAEHAAIEAATVLDRVDGSVDVTLKDLSFRWDVEHLGCSARPEQAVTELDRLTTPAMAAWSSCPALEADADWALTPEEQSYTVTHGADPETLDVIADLPPDPLFELSADRGTDVGGGACGAEFVSDDVHDVLNDFFDPMADALDATWDAHNPFTQQADGLNLLLSRFETGHFGDMSDVDLDLEFDRFEPADDRLRGHLDSEATIDPSEAVIGWSEFVYSPHEGFPCTPEMFPAAGIGCTQGTSFFGDAFDVSYSLTTGMLNQVIGQRYGTDHLFRALTPSCEDLGLPAGCGPDDQPVLDGTSLASLHPALAALGATQVAIELSPTLVPFTWIHPDPPTSPGTGNANVTYQLGQYQVDFVGDLPGPDGTDLWLSVIVDFFAPGLELDVAHAEDSNEILAQLGDNTIFHYTIVKSQLAGCPLVPHTNLPAGYVPPPCEGDVTSAVAGLVEPVLAEALLALVSQHPAPQMFDAFGEASREVQFDRTGRFQWRQIITLYGELAE